MKKLISTILSVAFILAIFVSSPQISTAAKYNQNIAANPLGLIFGILNVTYEQQIQPKNSFTVSGFFYSYDEDWTGGVIGGSYRFYLLQEDKRAIEGFSFGPLAQIAFWSYNGHAAYDGGSVFYIGGEAAYKWVFNKNFSVEPIFSLFFGLNQLTGLGGFQSYGLGVNLGYAW